MLNLYKYLFNFGVKSIMGQYKQIRQKNYQTPAHILVWESHHGKKPLSMIVHHIDGNNQNNNIDNLQLVTHYEHKKIHNGWIRDGNGILFNPKMEKRRQIRIEKKENIINNI